jgi:hypothetical protein
MGPKFMTVQNQETFPHHFGFNSNAFKYWILILSTVLTVLPLLVEKIWGKKHTLKHFYRAKTCFVNRYKMYFILCFIVIINNTEPSR